MKQDNLMETLWKDVISETKYLISGQFENRSERKLTGDREQIAVGFSGLVFGPTCFALAIHLNCIFLRRNPLPHHLLYCPKETSSSCTFILFFF